MKHFVSGAPVHSSETRNEPSASARCGSDISEPTDSLIVKLSIISLLLVSSSLSRGRIAPLENASGRHGHLWAGNRLPNKIKDYIEIAYLQESALPSLSESTGERE